MRNACAGHYRLKEITWETFLDTYLKLWIPPQSRNGVKGAVLHGVMFNGRQKNSVEPLRRLRANWPSVLGQVRAYDCCGLCGSDVPLVPARMESLYVAKMWSQLFYDSIVPFDTKSKAEIKRAGYPDPAQNFVAMNKELFADVRKLSDSHHLGVLGLRCLDRPDKVDPQLEQPEGGQPLSRVIDKIFYRP